MLEVGMMSEDLVKHMSLKEALKTIKELGYECADISLQEKGNPRKIYHEFTEMSRKEIKRFAGGIREYAKDIGLPLVSAHSVFPIYKKYRFVFNYAMYLKQIKCLKLCHYLGIKKLVMHPANDLIDDDNIKYFKRLEKYARKYDVTICIENMWRWDASSGRARKCSCSLNESFLNILKGVKSEYVLGCVDIGHAEMFHHLGFSANKMLEGLGNYVCCVHIHDNDLISDLHLLPFEGKIDFKQVALGLKHINYQGALIAETNLKKEDYFSFYTRQLDALKKIREMINS